MAAQARLSAIEMIEAHRLFDKPPLYMIGSFDSRVTVLAQQTRALSRWVPWELGLADGYKGMDSIAIFPAAEN
ncbi:MAG: hypothetical protein J0H88_00900, partial [Sphingomonadales bacterium]|nr:hypothetical protein [Sphingomonadales bacterium]